jgi:RND family efflux transporter MFP subunit
VAGCSEAIPHPAAEVRPVRTTVVDPKPIDEDCRAVGEVRPRYESDLSFRIAGKIVARTVEVGTSVKKGDLLAQLDAQDYRNKMASAETDVVAAEAVLIEARASEARLRQLLASGITTRANYDLALKNLRSGEAKLDSAKAALSLARDQVSYTELRAEFDGIVTAVAAEAGQVVNTGQMIVRLARPGDKDAVFSIAESVFANGTGNGPRSAILVNLLSNPRIEAEGAVREISPVADPATRTYQVKVTLRDAPEQMRFGVSVVGRLTTATAPVIVLPASALFDQGGRPAVWVVNPADSSVALKPVTIARYDTVRVVIREGLAKGDVVVTAGVNRLRDHQKVRLADGGAK